MRGSRSVLTIGNTGAATSGNYNIVLNDLPSIKPSQIRRELRKMNGADIAEATDPQRSPLVGALEAPIFGDGDRIKVWGTLRGEVECLSGWRGLWTLSGKRAMLRAAGFWTMTTPARRGWTSEPKRSPTNGSHCGPCVC